MELKPGYKQTEVGVIPENWCVKTLKSISPSQSVGLVINPSTYYDKAGTVPMLVGSNIEENAITWESAKRISESSGSLLGASRLLAGDLVTVRVGDPGTTAVIPAELDGCNCASMMIIRQHRSFNSQWLCYAMNSRAGRRQVEHVQYGTAQKQFNISDAIHFSYAVPPPAEQEAIAEALSDADALIEALEQLLTKKRQIKQGTLQELLTGKTRLPGFSGEWEIKRLSDLGRTFGGLTGKSKRDFGHGTARYISFMNVMTNTVIDCATFESVDIKATESQNHVAVNDLFFNGSSETPEEVGMCAVLKNGVEGVYLNSFCFGFRPNAGAPLDGYYLASYFRSQRGRDLLKSLAQGATRYNLSKTALMQVQFPLPTVSEQAAIASVLLDMEMEIVVLGSKLTKARQIKQGMMQELLTGRIRLV